MEDALLLMLKRVRILLLKMRLNMISWRMMILRRKIMTCDGSENVEEMDEKNDDVAERVVEEDDVLKER